MLENTGDRAVTVYVEDEDQESELVCVIEPGLMTWWDGKQNERMWVVKDADGQDILRQNLGLYSRNIKIPASPAIRGASTTQKKSSKSKQKKIYLTITNHHEATLEVYTYTQEHKVDATKLIDIEPEQVRQLYCLNPGHEFVVVNKETLFEVATLFGALEDQDVVLRPTLGLSYVNTGKQTVEATQLGSDGLEKALDVYIHPGQNIDYWALRGDIFVFRSTPDGKMLLKHRMVEECQVMVPSSSAEERRGQESVTVITIRNTFQFPLEIYPHDEDDLAEVESFLISPQGPSLQVESPIVGQLFKVINQESREDVAHIVGAAEDQFVTVGPQTFLEIKNSCQPSEDQEEVSLRVYYQPHDQAEEFLYDPDVLERGDAMEIECLLGTTWVVRNSATDEMLIRYLVHREAEDTNLVVLSSSPTVCEDEGDAPATKIHFINELGFPVVVYWMDLSAEAPDSCEQPQARLQNHESCILETFVGEEFLVRKEEDSTLGAVVVAAITEQACPLGDEASISFHNTSNKRVDVFFYDEVLDLEILRASIEGEGEKRLGAYRGHQWVVKDAYGQLVLNHTTQGELQHVQIPDSPAVGGEPAELTFENKFGADVELYWLESPLDEETYQGSILPKQTVTKET